MAAELTINKSLTANGTIKVDDKIVMSLFTELSTSANGTDRVYKDGREVTKEYPSTWYSWTRKTESGETFLGYGYTITVNNENYIFGGVVVGRFETYKQQLLTVSIGALTLSGKALCFSTDA